MRVVISYDISDNKRRTKIMKTLEGHGYRVQYSIFECDLTAKKLRELKKELRQYVKTQERDSVRFYPLPVDAVKKISVLGNDMARTLGVVAIV